MTDEAAARDPLEPADDVEIVIGIVAPLGSDVDRSVELLQRSLRGFGYESEVIRLSGFLAVDEADRAIGYVESHMNAGDALRERVGRRDILAGLAIATMYARSGQTVEQRKAWILRTIKDDAEARLLRQVYGSRFVLLATSSSESDRIGRVTDQLLDESADAAAGDRARRLVHRDQRDESNPFGQRVRDAFSSADFFVELESGTTDQRAHEIFDRTVGLLFGSPFLTPSVDEAMMYHAHAASLRSSDAGRQVGAVIAGERGEVLAIGSNEVPRAGGGEYWYEDDPDNRDFMTGHDFNKRQTTRLVREMLDALAHHGLLRDDLNGVGSDLRFDEVWSAGSADLGRARVTSLLEFGRVVHAEMSALMHAARVGVSIRGATLYTTTFPCHLCMRLIISAGISSIVFVDPYPKSLATEMYRDSLAATDGASGVRIRSFEGVGWTLFQSVFTAVNRRKDSGGAFEHPDPVGARYRLAQPSSLIAERKLETAAFSSVLTSLFDADAVQLVNQGAFEELAQHAPSGDETQETTNDD